jgi:Golgi casein kinase Fam20
VRLGTCIALELVCAVGAVAGVALALGPGTSVVRSYFGAHDADAATTGPAAGALRLPAAELRVPTPGDRTVFEASDDVLLAPVAATPLADVKLNRGGSSLSLRLTFKSGARAAFKPQQTAPQSDPRREIAAYRIDRLLRIGHVPPAKPGRFTVADLVAASDPATRDVTAQRIAAEGLPQHGVLQGELSWWIPEIRDATIGEFRVDELGGFALWLGYLQTGAVIPDDARPMVAQLATVVMFDILIDNSDRWSGNNTKSSVDNQTLYFMDNTLSFSTFTLGHEANLAPLRRMEVFPRELVARMRALTYDTVAKALDVGDDPLGPLLVPAEIHALLARRDHLLHHIDGLCAELGEKAVLALP